MAVYSRRFRHAVNPVVMHDERGPLLARRVTGRSPARFIETSGNSLQNHTGRANSESWRHEKPPRRDADSALHRIAAMTK
jgi:hypothetical protein